MREVFISTGAFSTKNIHYLLRIAKSNRIEKIELSSGVEHCANVREILTRELPHFKFLIHNYFPTPYQPFLLNLASNREGIVTKSISLCKNAIDMCSWINSPIYSVHCGFTFDSDGSHLGQISQMDLARIAKSTALDHMVNNLKHLADYAAKRKVKLAVENNVVADFALVDGQNEICLGASPNELAYIFDAVGHQNLFLLFDIGHAKVNQKTLGVEIKEYVHTLRKKIIAVHVSDNDGLNDQNREIQPESELISIIRELDAILIVESYDLTIDKIKQQRALLSALN